MIKTGLFLAEGFETVEALITVDLLRRAKIEVTTVSIKKERDVKSSQGVYVRADTDLDSFSFEDCDMIILPGGQPGTKNLKACKKLTDEILSFEEGGKDLAAICAAPTILAGLGLLDGKPATCYPGCDPEMDGADVTNEAVTVTGRIITGRAVGCAIPFALAIIARFLGQEKAEEIREEIVYRPEEYPA